MAIFNYGYIFYINFELKVNILIKISVKSSQYQRTCHTTGQENYANLKNHHSYYMWNFVTSKDQNL